MKKINLDPYNTKRNARVFMRVYVGVAVYLCGRLMVRTLLTFESTV